MILKVNNEQLDFELEATETQLGHIWNKISEYLQAEGYILLQVVVDGAVINVKESGWQQLNLAKIDELSLTAELMLELEDVIYALKLTEEALLAADDEAMLKLKAIWGRLYHSVRFWLTGFALEERLYTALLELSTLPQEPALKVVKLFAGLLKEKDAELNDIHGQLHQTLQEFYDCRDFLVGLSGAFQQGNDAKAMQEMLNFMQLFQKILRLSSFLATGIAREELIALLEELSGQLSAFTEACSAGDYILAADIAEYEISERLERLPAIIALLKIK